jgi:hypothetical protein
MRVADEAGAVHGAGEHGAGGHGQAGGGTLPHESLAPIAMAAGIAMFGFGLLTHVLFSVAGIALVGWSLAIWIGEMRHD